MCRKHIACRLSKATDKHTHTEYEILYSGFCTATILMRTCLNIMFHNACLVQSILVRTPRCRRLPTLRNHQSPVANQNYILYYKCTLKNRKSNNYTNTAYTWCPDINRVNGRLAEGYWQGITKMLGDKRIASEI